MSLIGSPYLVGGAAILAFSAGWSVNGWRHDAALKFAADKVRAEEQIKLDALRVSLDIANRARLSMAADLATEKAKLEIKYRTLTQEVPVYAPQNSDMCNNDLSPGLVGLLNAAARGGVQHPDSAAEPTGQRYGAVPRQSADLADD